MRGFEPDGEIWVAKVDGPFAGALARLAEQIATGLAGRGNPANSTEWLALMHAEQPHDPASLDPNDEFARLNPPVSRDDAGRAADFRRLTRGELDIERVRRLRALADQLRANKSLIRPVRLTVTPDDATGLAATFNDLRLVLAQRLDIQDAAAAEAVYERAQSGGPGAIDSVLYLVASALQDTLIELLLGEA